jgi:hypothetical protein
MSKAELSSNGSAVACDGYLVVNGMEPLLDRLYEATG